MDGLQKGHGYIHAVHTRMKSIKKIQPCIQTVLTGYTQTGNGFKGNIDYRCELKYENVAASAFRQEMKVKHFNFKLRDCGPMVSKTHKYLGASIDYIVSCDFHPERLMEMGLMSLRTL